MSVLRVTGLHAAYGPIKALHGVDLHVDEGEVVTLIGANGAGKSTLLKTIAGLIRPAAGGVVAVNDNEVTMVMFDSPNTTSAELIIEAGCPPGVVNVVTGFGRTAGAARVSRFRITRSIQRRKTPHERAHHP